MIAAENVGHLVGRSPESQLRRGQARKDEWCGHVLHDIFGCGASNECKCTSEYN